MYIGWRTINGLTRLSLALSRLFRLFRQDVIYLAAKMKSRILRCRRETAAFVGNVPATSVCTDFTCREKPVIFVSACVDSHNTGDWKYNGGIKEYNNLVKLLRSRGHEAYIVTFDGTYQNWLIEHQPVISLEEFRRKKKETEEIRCVTSWAIAHSFIRECDALYFWDMELRYTEHEQFRNLARLYNKKIVKTSGISRTIQAWHMAHFEVPCTVIPNLLDVSFWKPDEGRRVLHRVGYMDEGEHTGRYVAYLQERARAHGVKVEFVRISGDEPEILHGMQSCNLFISMNLGKDELWGEGCPRTVIEALSAGAVILAFDIIGNRETLIPNYNSVVVPRYRIDLLAQRLIDLLTHTDVIEAMRANSFSLLTACHTPESRWPAIKEFLDL